MPRRDVRLWKDFGVMAALVGVVLVLSLGTTRGGRGGTDGGEPTTCKGDPPTQEETLYDLECGDSSTVDCGEWCCPSSGYTCCTQEKDAPPECCKASQYDCYHGGGGLTGWPKYNGCNPRPDGCGGDLPKWCEGNKRNTCCPESEECDDAFGVAYCKDDTCPNEKQCNSKRLCCSEADICRKFLNVEYCHEDCAAHGKEKCEIIGDYYGDDKMHICCTTGTCRHHPDGWPYCTDEVK